MFEYNPKAWTPPDPEFRDRVMKKIDGNAFMHFVGFEVISVEAGKVICELTLRPEHFQQFGRVHGGVVVTIADIVAGFAAYTSTPKGIDVVTGEIKVSFFRPGTGQKLVAVGTVVKPGKTITFAEADVYSVDNGEITHIARANTSMVNINREQ